VAKQQPSIFFGVESLRAGNGGICRVARLMGRALDELRDEFGIRVQGVVLGDQEPPRDMTFPVQVCSGSRLRFALAAWRRSLSCTHFIYDAASVGQVHSLPLIRRRPSLMYIHGTEFWGGTASKYVAAARRITTLLVNSDYTRARAGALWDGLGRAEVCWLATERDDPAPEGVDFAQRPPRVLIVGRLVESAYKGHRELIACWPRVCARVPGATLEIVGLGPGLGALREQANRSPVADSLRFHGFVSEAELDRFYASTRVFAMPSRGEGFGLVYIEAMRHGLPVIASCHDAAPEVVLDGSTGFTVDLDRPDELPNRLVDLLAEPERARLMGEAGRSRWADHFRFRAFRDRFRSILLRFLGLEPSPSQEKVEAATIPCEGSCG
jgi:phosphatidylinositol alpha-1,6-mannosyltransferase